MKKAYWWEGKEVEAEKGGQRRTERDRRKEGRQEEADWEHGRQDRRERGKTDRKEEGKEGRRKEGEWEGKRERRGRERERLSSPYKPGSWLPGGQRCKLLLGNC